MFEVKILALQVKGARCFKWNLVYFDGNCVDKHALKKKSENPELTKMVEAFLWEGTCYRHSSIFSI